jgi:hypothetical protein
MPNTEEEKHQPRPKKIEPEQAGQERRVVTNDAKKRQRMKHRGPKSETKKTETTKPQEIRAAHPQKNRERQSASHSRSAEKKTPPKARLNPTTSSDTTTSEKKVEPQQSSRRKEM